MPAGVGVVSAWGMSGQEVSAWGFGVSLCLNGGLSGVCLGGWGVSGQVVSGHTLPTQAHMFP